MVRDDVACERSATFGVGQKYGHRLSGNNVGQLNYFTQLFPKEFSTESMPKVVLPMGEAGEPFVCDDGKLPSPMWATINALLWLTADPSRLSDASPEIAAEINNITKLGVQVEWRAFSSFLRWCVKQESADIRSELRVKPHLVDSALYVLSMLEETGGSGGVKAACAERLYLSWGSAASSRRL